MVVPFQMPKSKEPFPEDEYLTHLILAVRLLLDVTESFELTKAYELLLKRYNVLIKKHDQGQDPKAYRLP